MEISIITVNLNNKIGLQRTINSVLSQTTLPFEWIIIDGGSTDGSREIIENNAKHFSFWCSELDKGIYNAMNKGIAHANGDYCLFMNSGDELYGPSILTDAIPFIEKNSQNEIIYGDCIFVKDRKERIKFLPHKLTLKELFCHNLAHQSTFIKLSLLKKFLYDEKFKISSDYKLWLQAWKEGYSFIYCPIIISKFYEDGISSTNLELCKIEDNLIAIELFGNDFGDILVEYKELKKKYNNLFEWSNRKLPRALSRFLNIIQIIRNRIHT